MDLVALLGMLWVAGPSPASSAATHAVRYDRLETVAVDDDAAVAERVRQAVESDAARYGLSRALADGARLSAHVEPSAAGLMRVRIAADYAGVPLLRPAARAIVDPTTGRGVVSVGDAVPPLRDLDVRPVVTEQEAVALVEAAGASGAVDAQLFVDPRGARARLVWRVDPPLDLQRGTNPVYLVDARTGDVRRWYDEIRFAKARAFERNPVLDPVAGDYTLNLVTPGPFLAGPLFAAANCLEGDGQYCEPVPTAVPDAAGDFLYPAPDVTQHSENVQQTDTFAEVSIYYHADKFMQWLQGHGFAGLQCHMLGEPATLVANFREILWGGGWIPFNNAFFSGDCQSLLVFGQGSQVDFAYDGDIVDHELGHGVVQAQMGGDLLGFSRGRADAWVNDSGALNEAFADYLSSAFLGDPVVGDYVGEYYDLIEGPGVRVNANAFRCPDSFVGEVHDDSEAFAGALWDMQQQAGDVMVPVVLDTITLLQSDATFEEASALLIEVAGLHGGPDLADIAHDALKPRRLLDCKRVIEPHKLRDRLFVQPPGEVQPMTPPPLQLAIPVPYDANLVELTFTVGEYTGPFGGGGTVVPGLMARSGSPITFTYDTDTVPWMLDHDAETVLEGTDGYAQVPATSDAYLYVAFFNTGNVVMTIDDIEVDYQFVETGTTDDGGSADEGGEGGTSASTTGIDTDITDTIGEDVDKPSCSCRSPSGSPRALAWVALLWIAAPRRRPAGRRPVA